MPSSVGLFLCERTITEEHTHNLTAVNQFSRWRVETFPSPPQRFSVFALLTGGLGNVKLTFALVVWTLLITSTNAPGK